MSTNTIRIDVYFYSDDAARELESVFGQSDREISDATVEALSGLGFEAVESLRGWGDVDCSRRGRRLTLDFITRAGSTDDWEGPLVELLTAQGATHGLIDLFDDRVGVRSQYGYIEGQRTTIKRLLKALQAIDPSLALAEAVQRGSTTRVKRLLADGADPNDSGPAGKTPPVVRAVKAESPRILDLLLKAGAEVNRSPADTGETALHCCAKLGEHETRDKLAKLLVSAEADPNLRDADGWSPLLLAANHGSARLCELLLQHGGDANARLDDGRTVAMVAAGASNDGLGVLRVLEVHGADLTAVDGESRDVFFHALPRLDLEDYLLARGLERYVPEEEYVGDPVPDLFTAIRYNHLEKVDELVQDEKMACSKFNPSVPQTFVTALCHATKADRCEIVELLLNRGADPDVLTGYGRPATVLWWAAQRGNARIVAALLAAEANLESGSDGPGTPLLMAARGNHQDIVHLLLEAGANPRAQTREGRNALEMLLVKATGIDEARALLELLGDRMSVDDEARYRMFAVAVSQGRHWLLRFLAEEGLAVRASDLASAVAYDDLESFELLRPFYEANRSSGAEAMPEDWRRPPLATCCQQLVKSRAKDPARKDQQRIFRELLDMGVDVDEAGSSKETPLVALQKKKGFVEETRTLLDAGADPNVSVGGLLGGRLAGAFSALHVAAFHGLEENCRALIEAGADIELQEEEMGHGTALQIARASGKKKVVALLLEHGASDPPPRVDIAKLSLREAKRHFLEVSKNSPYVRLEACPTATPAIEGLAIELAEFFSRYRSVTVSDGFDDWSLQAAVVAPMAELEGYWKLGGGPHDVLLAKRGAETVYRRSTELSDDHDASASIYHWLLKNIEFAQAMAEVAPQSERGARGGI